MWSFACFYINSAIKTTKWKRFVFVIYVSFSYKVLSTVWGFEFLFSNNLIQSKFLSDEKSENIYVGIMFKDRAFWPSGNPLPHTLTSYPFTKPWVAINTNSLISFIPLKTLKYCFICKCVSAKIWQKQVRLLSDNTPDCSWEKKPHRAVKNTSPQKKRKGKNKCTSGDLVNVSPTRNAAKIRRRLFSSEAQIHNKPG